LENDVVVDAHRSALPVPGPRFAVQRHRLANGLRILVAPDPGAPVVAVAVRYGVGMRSEPAGRTGFAHLFEHLMFQGSVNLPKLEHFRYVESSGGTFNGSTHMDYTQYHEVLPSNALERGLFLEADRMREPALTEENLRLQIDVVKEEIRVNVRNKPYGGFPWLKLPGVLFDTFANAHDGYGSFEDLESATVADARQFFDWYYAPANALLCVAGDVHPEEAFGHVERLFGDIPYRPEPPAARFSEPPLPADRRSIHIDPHAPLPAVAAGWRVPDPVDDFVGYLPYVVLAKIMSGSESSRLERRLVRGDRSASSQSCYLGLLGDPFDVRDPTALIVQARHSAGASADEVLTSVDEEFRRVAEAGLGAGEQRRTVVRMTTQMLRETDTILGRAKALLSLEQQHGRAELLGELPELLAGTTEDEIRAAAAAVASQYRAVVELRPADRQGVRST
jgi:zinc protease